MKRGARMRSVVLLGLVALVAQNASAGSAVAMESHHGHLVSYHGYPVNEAKRLALETARSLYGTDVKIIAASDVAGYCAIAVARKGKGSVIGVALGKRSATEADALALDHCLNAGGTNPAVRWRFRG
jgi:hypothetical protein